MTLGDDTKIRESIREMAESKLEELDTFSDAEMMFFAMVFTLFQQKNNNLERIYLYIKELVVLVPKEENTQREEPTEEMEEALSDLQILFELPLDLLFGIIEIISTGLATMENLAFRNEPTDHNFILIAPIMFSVRPEPVVGPDPGAYTVYRFDENERIKCLIENKIGIIGIPPDTEDNIRMCNLTNGLTFYKKLGDSNSRRGFIIVKELSVEMNRNGTMHCYRMYPEKQMNNVCMIGDLY